MENKLQSALDTTMQELIETFSLFSEEQVNVIPVEGSWTAAQLAQHLTMSNSRFTQLLNGASEETNRAPGEKINSLRDVFLNFDTKLKSPEFIVPPAKKYDKEELLQQLKKNRRDILAAAEKTDLERTCLLFELPVIGLLTALEALHFVLYHTQRHVHQLKNIFEKVVEQHQDAGRYGDN